MISFEFGVQSSEYFTFISKSPHPLPLPIGDCDVKGKTEKNVMLNLFQHLIESNTYETLARSDERM